LQLFPGFAEQAALCPAQDPLTLAVQNEDVLAPETKIVSPGLQANVQLVELLLTEQDVPASAEGRTKTLARSVNITSMGVCRIISLHRPPARRLKPIAHSKTISSPLRTISLP